MEIEIIKYIVEQFGAYAVIVWMYWTHLKEAKASNERYEKMFSELKATINEHQEYYKNNVKLVESVIETNRTLKDIILMNTEAWKSAEASMKAGLHCPVMRGEGNCRAVPAIGMWSAFDEDEPESAGRKR